MTILGGVTISDRAKRLVEALHELHGNEARWMVAQAFLDEDHACCFCECPECWDRHGRAAAHSAQPSQVGAIVGRPGDGDGGG